MDPKDRSGLDRSAPDQLALFKDQSEILDTLRDAVVCLGRDWRIIYANTTARRISHIEPQHLNSRTYWELFPADIGTELELRYHRVMNDRVEAVHIFFYHPFQIWLDQRILPIESGIALLYRDVTAQKLEEGATLSKTRHLEQVLELTSDGIVYLDHSYNFTFLNRRARELLAPSGELLGACLWTAFPAMFYEGSPYVENLRVSMEQRLPCEFEVYYAEPLNLWFCIEARAADNGIIVFLRDGTRQHADRDALLRKQQESEQQLAEIESLYRAAPAGLALFDPVGFRYLRLNDLQAEFYARPAEQLLGHPVTEGSTVKGLRELFERVVRGEPVHEQLLEGELAARPGEYRYWTVNYHPVHALDGSLQAISTVSLEITQQKRAEAALVRSEKLAAVGRLAASISHEINNPLESITNLLYLIATDARLPVELSSFVEMAQGELARVSAIATQTLRFHRQSSRASWIRASVLFEAVLTLYAARLKNASIAVEAVYRGDAHFLCYENDLRQVLNNLISNAIDAMPQGGRLLVRAYGTTNHLTGERGMRLTVADTGHGMSAATQARALEPFYTTKDANGTGLGLWISSDIMTRHGGRLSFRSSEHPGRHGTVFSIFQPSLTEEQAGYRLGNADEPSVSRRQNLAS
jgi:signal transduction histidine kinase